MTRELTQLFVDNEGDVREGHYEGQVVRVNPVGQPITTFTIALSTERLFPEDAARHCAPANADAYVLGDSVQHVLPDRNSDLITNTPIQYYKILERV